MRRLRPVRDDAGMTLIELMVALVVFAIAATGLAAGFTSAAKTSGTARDRSAAANLAQREVEIVRNTFTATESGPLDVIAAGSATNPNPLPGGTAGQDLVVDGRPYRVVRSLSWLVANSGASSCDGGTAVNFPKLALDVTVSWPAQREAGIDPVETHTILTPPRGVLNSTLTFVAVKVIDAAGADHPGRLVRIRKAPTGTITSAYTGPDGCAVFGLTTTSTHTVWLDEDGYIDVYGEQLASKSITLAPSAFQRVDFSYDAQARIKAQLVTDAGHAIPSAFKRVALGAPGFTNGYRTFDVTGAPPQITKLWPVPSGYELWAGSCEQSDPVPNGGSRGTPVVVEGGDTSALIQARLTPVTINATRADGSPGTGVEIVAKPKSTVGCHADEVRVSLGSADATGVIRTALPAGVWTVMAVPYESTTYKTRWRTTPTLLPTTASAVIDVETP
jgi:prepilin-type N-terminal cleavage/methylation domain-containing protein